MCNTTRILPCCASPQVYPEPRRTGDAQRLLRIEVVCSAVTLCAPWSAVKAYSTGLHALCEYLSEAEVGKPK